MIAALAGSFRASSHSPGRVSQLTPATHTRFCRSTCVGSIHVLYVLSPLRTIAAESTTHSLVDSGAMTCADFSDVNALSLVCREIPRVSHISELLNGLCPQ